MDYVKRDQEEHPYAIGLNYGIDEKLSEFVCNELCVSVDCCECVVRPLWKKNISTSKL